MSRPRAGWVRVGGVGGSSVVVGLLGWLTLVLAARNLGPSAYADFSVMWGLFFAAAAVMFGIQQEITQSLSAAHRRPGPQEPHPPVVGHALVVAALLILLVVGLAPWWGADLDVDSPALLVLVLAVSLAALAIQSGITGVVVARDQLRVLAALLVCAAAIRVVSVALATWGGEWTVSVVMLAIASGSFSWVLLLILRPVRGALTAAHPHSLSIFLPRSGGAVVGAVGAGLLAAGFPLLLDLRTEGALPASAGVLLTAVVLTRTPLLLPLNGLQLVLLARLSRLDRPGRVLLKATALAVPIITALVAIAYVIGPEAQQLMFGDEFRSSPAVIALLTLAACLLVALTITGTALSATHRFGASALGWIVAVIGTVVVLGADASIEVRSVAALLTGPGLGIVTHSVALASAAPRSEESGGGDGAARG